MEPQQVLHMLEQVASGSVSPSTPSEALPTRATRTWVSRRSTPIARGARALVR